MTPLHNACLFGHSSVVQLLLEKRVTINIQDKVSPLSSCSSAHPPQSGDTALHYACKSGHAEVVSALLKEGADIRVKNKVLTSNWEMVT
jgi:ankyrin repeat protein